MKLLLLALALPLAAADHDIVIYGGTSAAVTAAVQAKQMGKSAVIVCPEQHLGGLTSGGLGWTDSGNKSVIGGLSRDFYHRIWKEYRQPGVWRLQQPDEYVKVRNGRGSRAIDDNSKTMWVFEPHVAEKIFGDLVREHGIPVHRDHWLDRENGVKKSGGRIRSITTLGGKTFAGSIFIDATYEGDLMAAAGVSFTVGREPNSEYGETLNGVQTGHARSHQFEKPVDPYIVPGDPSSGLLPRIHGDSPGEEFSGDHRVQAYCFRTCMTDHPDNLVPWPKPEGYDPLQYELALRYFQAGWKGVFHKFDPMPNRKTDTNNHGAFSFDNIGYNYDYPEASYERRREIIREHETYQKGLLWFIANDPRVPQDLRDEMKKWGLARDEFTDNGNWPHQIYVREARRMVGDFVVTEHHLRGTRPTPRPIGMGSYNMDSHNVQRYVDENGHARNEGDIQVNPGGPYPIDYGAILPRESECENLLVPVAVSSSHIAYGSIRMEPVFMILGQSAATAAAMAIDDELSVQDVPYDKLEKLLLTDGQVLRYTRKPKPPAKGLSRKELGGTVLDDRVAGKTGHWTRSSANHPHLDGGYLHDGNTADGMASLSFEIPMEGAGTYDLKLLYPPNTNRSTRTPVTARWDGGEESFTVDQTKPSSTLGRLAISRPGKLTIEIRNKDTDGHVVVDGVQLLPR